MILRGNDRIPVGVLAATGAVGQRFVQLLANHPWFELREVTGSERGAGRPYGEVVAWRLPGDVPEVARNLIVRGADEELTTPIVFSALPAEVAGRSRRGWRRRGTMSSATRATTGWTPTCR
ncbi:MAG: hypothetical protein U0841_28875 [Chloroflexia bacterium]